MSSEEGDRLVEDRKFEILKACDPRKTLNNVERLVQRIESDKRKICLARMRKEEETRGKSRRNKAGVRLNTAEHILESALRGAEGEG